MFMIIYKKSTKHIVAFRGDNSTTLQTAEYWFSVYLKDNKISTTDAVDFAYAETEAPEWEFDSNKYKWNESTSQAELDPSYVPPTPTEPVV